MNWSGDVIQPLNEFTVREQDVGGGVLRVVRRRGSQSAYLSRRMIILVHGFNVPQQAAVESFATFHGRLSDQLSGVGRHLPPIWAFYWPGDHESRGLSAATYSARIPVAERAGERLGKLLTKLDPAQQVILIAHSLGCRVVLEALRYVADEEAGGTASAEVPVACLLAAAVPVGRCVGQAEPYAPSVITNTVHVLYSCRDRILQWTFRVGQHIYGEDKGEAVGRNGWPVDRWAEPYDTGLGHKGYWSASQSVDEVARVIEPTLSRGIAIRYLPAEEPNEGRNIEARRIADRSQGDDLDSAWTDCWPTAGV